MDGEHGVGRVIARPFDGSAGRLGTAREGRRDYARRRPARSYLEELQDAGVPVHAVGKIRDLFAGVGIDVKHEGDHQHEGRSRPPRACSASSTRGLIFVNLVDTDQVYGHRKDVEGFHDALREIDAAVAAGSSCCGPTTCWS